MKIGLTYDLRSEYLAHGYREDDVAEFDSDETISALESSLRANGQAPERIGNARALCERLARGDRWDMVFNIAEGLSGLFRESQVPCLLELYAIPYTFSDPFVCALTLDKSMSKRLVTAAGLRTPAFHVVHEVADIDRVALRYPLFAKPLAEGTGKGITSRSRVDSDEELASVCRDLLEHGSQPVLVEEFLPGREFTVGILGNGPEAHAIGTMEIVVLDPSHRGIYSYETKEKCETMVRYSSLPPGTLRAQVEDLSLRSYRAIGCRDTARADIRLDQDGKPSFMEINPLPGLHPKHSDLPMIATAAGMSHAELVGTIVRCAARRAGIPYP